MRADVYITAQIGTGNIAPTSLRARLVPKIFGFWLLALLFVFGKNCSIMDYLGLKDSSRKLQTNCAISYSFTYI